MTQTTDPQGNAPHFASRRAGALTGIDQLREELRNAPEMRLPEDEGPPVGDYPADYAPDGRDGPENGPPDVEDGSGRGQIWPGCPVQPLGVYGDVCFYLDVLGQLRAVDNHSQDKIRSIFGGRVELLAQHFPQFTQSGMPKVRKFDQAEAAAAMTLACADLGVWSPTGRARGAGCWTDEDGKLIYHAGDAVLIDGEWLPPGVYDKKVYSAADPIPRPAKNEPREDPVEALFPLLKTWNWRRPDVDPHLVVGMMCAMMICGAAKWRPVSWFTGDRSTGKSSLHDVIKYVMGGEAGLIQSANATEAGVRSLIGFSSLPVAIDEFEPDPDNPKKTTQVIELARIASSGGQILRGSTDQKGHQSNIYSSFIFSSILLPAMRAQDVSRLIVLNLDALPEGAAKPRIDPKKLRRIGEYLRRRLVDGWPTWNARLEAWASALARHEITGRGADNLSTVLAAADMAMGAEIANADVMNAWAEKIGRFYQEESTDDGSNADGMLLYLMSQSYDVWRRGERWLISQFIMAAAALPGAPDAIFPSAPNTKDDKQRQMNAILAKIGLRVNGFGHEAELFIPNSRIQGLCDLFEGSDWANGVWHQAAARIPGAHKRNNVVRLGGMPACRGTWVPFKSMPGLLAFNHDLAAGMTPASKPLPPDMEEFQ